MFTLDHLAVTCADLGAGTAWVEQRLGQPTEPGGQHALFATHNRLIRLGDGAYLEVIAPDTDAPPPARPRWFALDRAGPPVLGNWIVRSDSLTGLPPDAGEVLSLSRGALHWQIAVPSDGSLPWRGGFPTVIAWGDGVPHPSTRLPDRGLRLVALDILHPDADLLHGLMAERLPDPRVTFVPAAAPSLRARIATPGGELWL
jgi:hypothetical protein